MSYVYRQVPGTGAFQAEWSVGYYHGSNGWTHESQHTDRTAAVARVHYLNGGIENYAALIAEKLESIFNALDELVLLAKSEKRVR